MNKTFLVIGIVLFLLLRSAVCLSIKKSTYELEPIRKRIFIVSTTGGGCNAVMFKSLENYLKDYYDIVEFFPIKKIFRKVDPCYKFTFGYYNGEDV